MAGEEMCGRRLQESGIDRTLLWSWGANSYGQLGTGCVSEKVLPSDQPVPINLRHELDAIKDAGGGGGFSFILTESGKVLTCGNNNKGQLGQDILIEKLTVFSHCQYLSQVNILKVAAGWDFMLGLSDTGCVLSWGSNSFGQLGRTLREGVNCDEVPTQVDGCLLGQHIVDIAAGLRHGLSLSECGQVYAWGHGKRGQLGSGDTDNKQVARVEKPILVQVPDTEKPIKIVAGMFHSGILTETGRILLWGCNKFGQCGREPSVSQTVLVPSKVGFPTLNEVTSQWISFASGWTHIMASSGALYSWGRADLGQLGRFSDKSYDHVPKLVDGLPPVLSYTCGSEHTLAMTASGQMYCWGWNEHSICGTDDEENVLHPQEIPLFLDKCILGVGCGAGHSFCIVAGDTSLCAGNNVDKHDKS